MLAYTCKMLGTKPQTRIYHEAHTSYIQYLPFVQFSCQHWQTHLIIYLGISIRLHIVAKEETSHMRILEHRFTFRYKVSQYLIYMLMEILVAGSLHNIKQMHPIKYRWYSMSSTTQSKHIYYKVTDTKKTTCLTKYVQMVTNCQFILIEKFPITTTVMPHLSQYNVLCLGSVKN